ncbi:MAG: protein translocase subunit SecD [Hyphomicrobiales bacterium]|nr:protein translocase subunit SecD [Hyphomicrobiales bacterium]
MLHFARWKAVLILLVGAAGILFSLPNFVPVRELGWIPSWLPHKQLVLGLDLQGGVHLLWEVDTASVIDSRLKNLRDDVRSTLRTARIQNRNFLKREDQSIDVRLSPEDRDAARRALRDLAAPVAGSFLTGNQVSEVAIEDAPEGLTLRLTEEGVQRRIALVVEQSIEVIRRRIDQLGTTEPTIQRQGADRILVQVPGEQNPERVKDLVGKTAKLVFRLVDLSITPQQAMETRVPPGSEIVYSQDQPPQPYLLETREIVAGENLVDAQPGFDQRTNEPIVTFRFDTQGAKRFGVTTQQNVGRPFAIVLDGQVISAPVIREPILGGTGQISGNFTVEEANDLSILLRAGALPAKLTIVEERTVGPGLGADSIEAGKIAAIIGTVAVIVFMVVAYGLFGIFANVALFANLSLIVGALSMLQATLTLPGIAGIVLTVGMAVDSNVLIFERIREELRSGKSAIASIDAGFTRALGTILDANITTFIAAVILFQLGSGPIRGFAVTLAIGIVTTVFTAFTLTRLIVATWLKQTRPSTVPI